MMSEREQYMIRPIGQIEVDESRGIYRLHVDARFQPALMGLGSCTHAIVLWWAHASGEDHQPEDGLVVDLPYAPGVRSGVFANRSEIRPNPIGITTSFILAVDEVQGTVDLAWIDAFDGTPLVDIKPYLPMSDRVMDAAYPQWLEGFPDSMEAAAAFFADPENAAKFS